MTEIAFAPGIAIAAARRQLAAALRAQNFDTPELDARVLIGHALGLDHAALIRDGDRALDSDRAAVLTALAARRLRREPVARIVGMKEFWSLPLTVSAATLVPRPETETVVEAALAAVEASGRRHQALRLLDIGTGSGALLLALLSELPKASGIGTDVSAAALAVARGNARRLGFARRAQFVGCDLGAALRERFDLIVCNPPYVARDAIANLAPGVRDYEPHLALDGGADGLDVYHRLADELPRLLAPEGRVVVEFGAGQGPQVGEIFAGSGLAVAAMHADLTGSPRALNAMHAWSAESARKKALGLLLKTD